MDILIIIDMQNDLFTDVKRFDSDNVIKKINRLSCKIRSNNGKVIFISHISDDKNWLYPGTKGFKLLDELEKSDIDKYLTKTSCDAFIDTELESFLKELNPNKIIITGCATEFCVDSTIKGAVNRGFNITAVSDCHTTADREHLDAEKIIEHHNLNWKNLILKKSKIEVLSCEEVLRLID